MRTQLCVLWVQLSTFDLHNSSCGSMDDNVFENSVLFTRYLTLNFSISVLLSAWFEWMPHFTFSFLKGSRTCDESCVLNYSSTFEAEIIRVFRSFFLESSFWNTNFHMPGNSKAAPYFLDTNKFKGKYCKWRWIKLRDKSIWRLIFPFLC